MDCRTPEPLALRLPQAARMLSISPRTLQAMASRGEVRSLRVSQRLTLYRVVDLQEWLDRKAGEATR